MKKIMLSAFVVLFSLAFLPQLSAASDIAKADTLYRQGNRREAFAVYKKIAYSADSSSVDTV